VLVAVIAVRVVEMAADEVVDVITVGHALVTAAFAMCVVGCVVAAVMARRAGLGSRGVHLEHVLVDVIAVRMMQMTLVQVVDVVAVLDGRVPTSGAVLVRVLRVDFVVVHTLQSARAGRP
jgi:hypothetical protein